MRSAARARALAACAGVLATLLGTADAQTHRTVTQVERDRRAETARAERLRRQAEAAGREVSALDVRLQLASRRRAEADAAAAVTDAELSTAQQEINAQTARDRAVRQAFENAVITAAFANRSLTPRSVHAGMFASVAAVSFTADHTAARQRLADAQGRQRAAEDQRAIIAQAQDAIDAERADIVTLQAHRRAAQNQLVQDAAAAERRVRLLATEARNLRELAARVERASTRPRNTRPGASAPSVVPASWLSPAQGAITSAFGERRGEAPPSQGVILRTSAGAQVVSPAGGEVAYAGLFRSYGQVLIINLDGGYALVLTGLSSVRARVGDTVVPGQLIGVMQNSDTPAPELYVEVRREGRPIDPGRWLTARGLAAGRAVGDG